MAAIDRATPSLSPRDVVALFRREGFLIREEHRARGTRLHGHLPERLLPAFRRAGHVRELEPTPASGWR